MEKSGVTYKCPKCDYKWDYDETHCPNCGSDEFTEDEIHLGDSWRSKTKIKEDWTKPKDGVLDVPDCLMPLFNKIGNQIRFHTISGKDEILTIANMLEASRQFFSKNPELLENGQSCKNE